MISTNSCEDCLKCLVLVLLEYKSLRRFFSCDEVEFWIFVSQCKDGGDIVIVSMS